MPNDPQSIPDLFKASPDCPALDKLVSSLDGLRGAVEQKRAEDHVVGCSYCATQLASYREFESPDVRPGEQEAVWQIVQRLRRNSPVERVAWWRRLANIRILAPAAIALAAVVLTIALWPPASRRQSLDFSNDNALRSNRVEVVAPLSVVHATPEQLAWKPFPRAAAYRVILYEVDNTEIWRQTVSATTIALPEPVKQKMMAPKTLQWQVIALDPFRIQIGESGLQKFSITR